MNRRRFLAVAALAGAIPVAGARPVRAATRAAGIEPIGGPLPVGYAAEAGSRFRDATALYSGYPSLTGSGLRLGIAGLVPGRISAGGPRHSVAVDVGFLPFHDMTFRAWEHTLARVARTSSPIGLQVPIDLATGLNLRLAIDEAQPGGTVQAVRLTAGRERSVPKLQPGYYAIPLVGGSSRARVDWDALRLTAGDRGALTVTGPGQLPASMLLLSVARA